MCEWNINDGCEVSGCVVDEGERMDVEGEDEEEDEEEEEEEDDVVGEEEDSEAAVAALTGSATGEGEKK